MDKSDKVLVKSIIPISMIFAILIFLAGSLAAQSLTYDQGGIVRGPLDRKQVALVFAADSYGEGGEYILAELERKGVRASFFLTGNFLRNPEFQSLVEAMVRDGHYLGPHSDRHLLYCDWQDRQKTLVSREVFLADLEANYAELARFGIERSQARYFLPPYEWYNRQVADWAAEAGAVIVNFTPGIITSADYTTPDQPNYRSSEEIYRQLLDYEATSAAGLNGFIILVHPGVAPERTDLFYFHLGQLIDDLKDRGYSFKRIDELLSVQESEADSGATGLVSAEGRKITSGNLQKAKTGNFDSAGSSTSARPRSRVLPENIGEGMNVRSTQPEEKKTYEKTSLIQGFPLTRQMVSWMRGKITGLSLAGDRLLAICDLPERLSGQLISLESGKLTGSFFLPAAKDSRLLAGQGGFCLVYDNRVVAIDGKTGEIKELELELAEVPAAISLAAEGRLILLFSKKIEVRHLETGHSIREFILPVEAAGLISVSNSEVIAVLTSGQVLRLDLQTGRKIAGPDFKEEITGLQVDSDDKLFLATASGYLVCFDLKKSKILWKLNPANQKINFLLTQGRFLYALTSGGIIYKLNRRGGDILWWQTLPARPSFQPVIFKKEILVPAGTVLFGFDLKTGQKSSETGLSFEVKTDPVASGNLLLIGTYDYRQDLSLVYALKKEPRIILRPSKESPQPVGQRVVFSVLASGWEKPKYEFYLQRNTGPKVRARKASRHNTWTWLPAEPGEYTISVRVFDGKISKKAWMRYNITSLTTD